MCRLTVRISCVSFHVYRNDSEESATVAPRIRFAICQFGGVLAHMGETRQFEDKNRTDLIRDRNSLRGMKQSSAGKH